MKAKLFISLSLILVISTHSSAQNLSKVKGRVIDISTRKPIIDANITIEGTHRGTTTDSLGYFQLKLPSNNSYAIIFSHINYDRTIRKLFIKKNEEVELNIQLKFHPIELPKVTITSEKHFEDTRAFLTIDNDELEKTKEKDVEKALKYLYPDMIYSDWFHTRFSGRNNLYNNIHPNFTLYINRKRVDSSDLNEINIDDIKYIRVWKVWHEVDTAPIDIPLVDGNYVLLIVTK